MITCIKCVGRISRESECFDISIGIRRQCKAADETLAQVAVKHLDKLHAAARIRENFLYVPQMLSRNSG